MESEEKGEVKDGFQVTGLASKWIEVFFVRWGFSSVVENLGAMGAGQDFCVDSIEWNCQEHNFKLVKSQKRRLGYQYTFYWGEGINIISIEYKTEHTASAKSSWSL